MSKKTPMGKQARNKPCATKRIKPIKLSNNKKRKIDQLISHARLALQQGQAAQCDQLCADIETLYPQHPEALHIRGLLFMQSGDFTQAEISLQLAADCAPSRADFIASLGNLQFQTDHHDAAITLFQQALTIDPHDIAAHLGLAGTWMAQEKYREACDLLNRIRKRHPGETSIRMGLFQACHALQQHDEARSHLEAIIARDNKHGETHYRLAILAVEQGDLKTARRHIHQTLQNNPFHSEAWLLWVDLQRFDGSSDCSFDHSSDQPDENIEAMLHIHQQSPQHSETRMNMAFALAKVYDDLKQYSKAFSLLQEANSIRHLLYAFDTPAAVTDIERVIQTGQTTSTDQITPTDQSPAPHQPCLFIVGMPRSGTTLIEQILAAHPQVTTLGENGHLQAAIQAVVGSSLSPAELNALPDDQCAAIGAIYLERITQAEAERIEQLSPTEESVQTVQHNTIFCDKTLSHINLLGLIHRALPQARFIHVQRNPLDTCLSIFKNKLQGAHFGYGSDLTDLTHYYTAYQRLMAHWEHMLPTAQYYNMIYEQLVNDQQPQTRALLQACQLDWNESCMHFQQANKHAVQTASAIQVRQPISARSIGLWKHYQDELSQLQRDLSLT